MESIPLEMEDIYGEAGDGEFAGDLPEMPEELQPEAEEATEGNENSAEVLRRLKKLGGAGKKVVKRPQPKLDADRLTGERGIGVLPGLFKDMKFRGKGYEAADLKQVMQKLEHWGHRLFPKMTFDEVLERLERLGSKKPVQNCVKRIRLDMPVAGQELVDDDEEDATVPAQNGADIEEDPFDVMLRQEREKEERKRASSSFFPSSPVPSTSAVFSPQPSTSWAPPAQSVLTPEQRERMERNKRLALERKAAKARMQAGEQTERPSLDDSMTGESPGGSQVPSIRSPASPSPRDKSSPTPGPATPSSPHSSGASEGFHGNSSLVDSPSVQGEEDQAVKSSSQDESDLQNDGANSPHPSAPENSAGPDSTSTQDELPDSQTAAPKHWMFREEQEAATQESGPGEAGQEPSEKTPVDDMYTEEMEAEMESRAETEPAEELEEEAETPAKSSAAGPRNSDSGRQNLLQGQGVVTQEPTTEDSGKEATEKTPVDDMYTEEQMEEEVVTHAERETVEEMEEEMATQAERETVEEMEEKAGRTAESSTAGQKDQDVETQAVSDLEDNNRPTKEVAGDPGEATQETQWPGAEAAGDEEGNAMDQR